jgi:hypothetical protein
MKEKQTFHDKTKRITTTKLELQKIFKGISHTEKEDRHNYERINLSRWIDKEMRIKKKIEHLNNKMTGITTYLSIITLDINYLNSPIKI